MMRWTLLCLLLAGCAAPHEPERDGVWISVPREVVRCEQRPEGVVCRSYLALPVVEVTP